MSAPSDCSICYDPVTDFPAPEATGSHRSSCGHIFHPKCIAKWHNGQEHSTCPMCRKVAVEMEDCAIEEESEDDEEEEDVHEHGGVIQISRFGMDYVLRQRGGLGVTAGVEAEVGFDVRGEAIITRHEFERIAGEQGVARFSDAMWIQLTAIYPAEDDDDAVVGGAIALFTPPAQLVLATPPPQLSFTELPHAYQGPVASTDDAAAHATLVRAGSHDCPLEFFEPGVIPPIYSMVDNVVCDLCRAPRIMTHFYHCAVCKFDICAECFIPREEDVVHAPGPFDFVEEPPRFTLRRADIQRLLQTHGSTASMEEFFNEEDGEEETLVVTMTIESLNNRFTSLGATPVTLEELRSRETLQITAFADGTRDVIIKQQRIILNPEEDPEL